MDGRLRNMTSVYITDKDRMLLLFRQGGRVVNEVWVGSAGGHFEESELNDAKTCVLRELKEELGVDGSRLKNLRLRYITLRAVNGEIRQNYYFFAGLKDGADEEFVSNEGKCRWFSYSELTALEMPYSAKFVIEHYLETGRETKDIYVGVADGEKLVFTKLAEF